MEGLADELPNSDVGRASQSRFIFSCAAGGPDYSCALAASTVSHVV